MTLEKAKKNLANFIEKSNGSYYSFMDLIISPNMVEELQKSFPQLVFSSNGSITTVRFFDKIEK